MDEVTAFPIRGVHRRTALKMIIRQCVETNMSTAEIVRACEDRAPDVNLDELASCFTEVADEVQREADALERFVGKPRL